MTLVKPSLSFNAVVAITSAKIASLGEDFQHHDHHVADEDAGVCDRVQRNLESGVYDVGVLSPKWEYPLEAFHRLVRETVGD